MAPGRVTAENRTHQSKSFAGEEFTNAVSSLLFVLSTRVDGSRADGGGKGWSVYSEVIDYKWILLENRYG